MFSRALFTRFSNKQGGNGQKERVRTKRGRNLELQGRGDIVKGNDNGGPGPHAIILERVFRAIDSIKKRNFRLEKYNVSHTQHNILLEKLSRDTLGSCFELWFSE